MDKIVKHLDLTGISEIGKKKALTYAIEARKAEIDRFWARTIVFWGFVAATFVAFGALYDKANFSLLLLLCGFGFLSSLAWTMQNRGSKYWQEAWEKKLQF